MSSHTRRACLVAAIVLSATAVTLVAQQNWYDFYDQAVEHVGRGEWEPAETKLQQAKKLGPAPGNRVLRYGMLRRPFFPDFYLGIVYLNTNRPTDALKAFALARAQKINPQDREFALLADMENTARTDEKRLAAALAMPSGPKPPATAEPAPQTARADTDKPVTPPAALPEKKIVDNPPPAPTPATTERDRSRENAERNAMQQFFEGNYRDAVATLDKAERDLATRLSTRGYFYRACAMAAQALRSTTVNTKLLEDARKQYAEVIRNSQRPLPDRQYISPRILNALGS